MDIAGEGKERRVEERERGREGEREREREQDEERGEKRRRSHGTASIGAGTLNQDWPREECRGGSRFEGGRFKTTGLPNDPRQGGRVPAQARTI